MNTRNKWMGVGLLALLFVGSNLYLIKTDADLIDRTSIVHDQKQAQIENLQHLLVKNGVIDTAAEQHVYFSEQLGMFTRFLVEEGQMVTQGTPLYEYTVLDLEEQRLLFESEAEQLSSEISSLESYIGELSSIESQLPSGSSPSTTNTPTNSLEDEELMITIGLEVGIDITDATIDQTRSILNQKIGEQEAVIGRLEAEQEKFERLISGLEESPVVTIESEFDGKIANLAEDMGNPLITIHTESLVSKSTLTEAEAREVLTGMSSRVTSPVANATVDGAVLTNTQIPEEQPVLGSNSLYPVAIDLFEQGNEWFIGQHVVNEIVLDESLDATTVPIISLDEQQRVNVLSATGLVEPRMVEFGLRVEDRQEALDNVAPGEWIVADPKQVERFNSPYLAQMTIKRLTFDNLDHMATRDNWKHLLLGVLPH